MAYGFLRRVFEVFERFRTAVDVVTTSEVSVSVTVDDRRHLDAIVEALSEFAEVSIEPEMALLCAVGRSPARRAGDRGARRRRARRGAAADDLAGGVAPEHHRRPAAGGSAARHAAPARGVLRMSHEAADRRLRQDGPAGRRARAGAGHRDRRPRRRRARRVARRPMSPIDFSTADALLANFPRYVERRLPRGHRHHRLGRARRRAAGRGRAARALAWWRRRISRSASTCFSWWWPRPRGSCRRRRSTAPGFTRRITPPSATRRPARRSCCATRWSAAGFDRPIDMSSTRAGHDSRHAHDRIRRPLGYDRADPHGARPPRLRRPARCCRRGGSRDAQGWFSMQRRAEAMNLSVPRWRTAMRRPFTGVGTALITPFTQGRFARRGGGQAAGAAADRRGRPLPLAVRHDRRSADAEPSREAARRRARRRRGRTAACRCWPAPAATTRAR